MTLYTIGYEGINIDAFIECLRNNNIKVLADVRQSPHSRKPGFSQKKLKERADTSGIVYKHFQFLGCPVDIRDAYSTSGDWNVYCKNYNLYLKKHPEAIDEVLPYIRNFSCALMCFEADPNRCHRSLIAQVIIERDRGIAIQNLHPSKNQILVGELSPCFA
jgi:uncharacterized protein (DUF488 family)